VHPDARSTVADFDHSNDPALWHKRIHAAGDPGRPANIHVRVEGWPGQQFALLFTDWLTAHPGARTDYLAAKRAVEALPEYPVAKEPWFLDAYRRAWEWADAVGWRP
jgi:dephospho-CoA kinase